MGKYLIVDMVWEINFPQGFNDEKFNCFKIDEQNEAKETINFEFIDKIDKLNIENYEENGLKMYYQDGIKLFDIKEKDNVIVRGKYLNNTSTFQIINTFDDSNKLIEILSFMRLAELSANNGVITLLASAVTMGEKAVIVVDENSKTFVNMWLNEIEDTSLISEDKLFVKIDKNIVKVYNNPWSKQTNINKSISIPLNAVLFVSKGKENDFIEQTDTQTLLSLAMNLGIMTDNLSNEALMQFCLDLLDRVNILKYRGKFNNVRKIFNKIYFS